MTTIDQEKVKEVLTKIRPFLQQDGGDVEFVGIDGTKVSVRLQGACGTCPHAIFTLKNGIERVLKEEISNEIEVISA